MRWIAGKKPRLGVPRMFRDESGQSLIVVAFAIVALIAIIGLGVDLGLVFVERVRLARAMDAAALAGAQELPSEEAAHQRALEYLQANGYDIGTACIETHGSNLSGGPGSCNRSSARTVIIIDTYSYRDAEKQTNTANRINVRGRQNVSLTFVRVVGFDQAPVSASATAENIEDLDIVIVYDRSGSMQEDTRCYGCWEPDPVENYPAGKTYPLPFADPDTGIVRHCEPPDPLAYEGYWYVTIEAEHYSRYLTGADYHRDWTEYPKIWWAMQRQPGVNASGPDERGSFMKVGPHSEAAIQYNSLGEIVHPEDYWTTPRLDYDFTVPEAGTYYVWIRAQGGVDWWANTVTRRRVYVGLNGTPMATGETRKHGPYNDGADPDAWRWTRVGEDVEGESVLELGLDAAPQAYTLNIWAAGPGFSLDKIVITNDPRSNLNTGNRPLAWTYYGIEGGGPTETHGRTDWACLGGQDPRFVPEDPTTGELDDLYDDFQPIRASKEAAKNFVRRLDPQLDQIGYVWYSWNAEIVEELYCLKQGLNCSDFGIVLRGIESTYAEGNTNIADALWDGLRVLSTSREPNVDPRGRGLPPKSPGMVHYGRPSAAHILVLMTDGQANTYPGMKEKDRDIPDLPRAYGNCYSDDLWPDQPGETTDQRRARECVVWFANHARDRNVIVYTIGLGAQADNELLAHVADITGGQYFFAPSAKELDSIFKKLLERIFLRLTD